jgi:DNA modification methylase
VSNAQHLRSDAASSKAREVQDKFVMLSPSELIPHPENPRKHSRPQIRSIAKSIQRNGYTSPIIVDKGKRILAGHGRREAALLLGLPSVPVIICDDLTEEQGKAYMLADNKLTDRSTWNDHMVATILQELSVPALELDLESTGFETPEIDFRIQSLDQTDAADVADEFEVAAGPPTSILGDVWNLGDHRIYCGNALDPAAYQILLEGQKAVAAFTDPPYNVKVDGHVSGNGSITHREFAMASGEMSGAEYTDFLANNLTNICTHTTEGALLYACMDWRHMGETLAAAKASKCELMNLCVWAKSNGGMGSLYRSRHELVFVFRNGNEPHQNNIQLGRFGRNRTNVWNYPSANNFGRKNSKNGFGLHPTVKPILLVADAIHDSTTRGDIVLDPFLGSGTTVLASERTGRRCCGIEIDPLYVDTAIDRWQRMSGRVATHANGETFETLKASRRTTP